MTVECLNFDFSPPADVQKLSLSVAQRLERLRKERQNQIRCKNIQWKDRSGSQSGNAASHLATENKKLHKWFGR